MAKAIDLSGIPQAAAARIAAEHPRLPVRMEKGRFDAETRQVLGRYMLDSEIDVLERVNQGQGDGFLLFPDAPATTGGQTSAPGAAVTTATPPSAAPAQRITKPLSLTEASKLFRENPEAYAEAAENGFAPKVSA